MSTEIAALDAVVAAADDELGRAAADVHHQVRRPASAGRPAHRAGERQPGLLVAGDHLGLDAQGRLAPCPGSRRRCAASRDAEVATIRTRSAPSVSISAGVVGQRHPGPLDRLRAPAGRCGRRPGRAGRSPSAGPGRPAARPARPTGRAGRRPAAGSSWSRSRSPPHASSRRHPTVLQPQQHPGVAEGVRLDPFQVRGTRRHPRRTSAAAARRPAAAPARRRSRRSRTSRRTRSRR